MPLPALTKQQEAAFDGPFNYCATKCLGHSHSYYAGVEACAKECVVDNHLGSDSGSPDPSAYGLAGRLSTRNAEQCADLCRSHGWTKPGQIQQCQEACTLFY
jgi:hypothetical protein